MSTIRICDSCKKEIKFSESVHFLGSNVLSDVNFCENCFKEVEKFILEKYQIETGDKKIYGQK